MKINFNMSAIIANNALTNSDNKLSDSLEKLSSGFKINHAKDNAAGLAISKRMNLQIKGLTNAASIASNGISVIETAEGALSEVHSMIQRMKELAVQSSNGTCTSADRSAIQSEVIQLKEEIHRLAEDTEYNGQSLLNGSFDLKGYSNNEYVKVKYYSDETPVSKYGITVNTPATYDVDGNVLTDAGITLGTGFPTGSSIEAEGTKVKITADNGFEINIDIDKNMVTPAPVILDITGIGAMTMQIGANEGQELNIRIPTISLENMDIEDTDLSTQEGALKALDDIDNATAFVSKTRSRLGAYQNRLEHTISSLNISGENMTSAYSRIMDVDMATEMTEYTKYQIMSQAGTSMLAQANERPQKVLQLLE